MKSKLLTSMCVVTLIWAFSGVSFAQPTLNFTVLPADLADGPMSICSILDVGCADTGIVYTSIDPYNNPRPAELREQIYNREDEFGILDIDSDGFLSMTEYNGPQQLFQDMDINQDMKLSIEEARYMMTFADIPYGSFIMGTDNPIQAFFAPAEDGGPEHEVTIDGFKMSATEVTTAQYCRYLNSALQAGEITVRLCDSSQESRITIPVPAYVVSGSPGTEFAGKRYTILSPVTALSHNQAPFPSPLLIPEHPINQSWIRYRSGEFYVEPGFEEWPAAFIKWWGAMAFAKHYGLSLPTEAEWEYVASGGQQYDFPTSDGTTGCQTANYACYNVRNQPDWTWTDTPDEFVGFRIAVGSYPPNPYGVYDMAGSVWEWTFDWYRNDFYQYCMDNGITSNPLNLVGTDPPMDGSVTGGPAQPLSHDARVCRGGSYNYHEPVTRTQYRFPVYSFIGNDHFGFRVVQRQPNVVFNGYDVFDKPDSDGDSIPDDVDNCPNTCNSQQLDADSDGIGDVCDDTPGCGGCGQGSCEIVCCSNP